MFETIYEDGRILYCLKNVDSEPLFIFRSDHNSFDTFLLLLKMYYQMAQDSINGLIREIENTMVEVKITSATFDGKKIIFNGYNMVTNAPFGIEKSFDDNSINKIYYGEKYSRSIEPRLLNIINGTFKYHQVAFDLLSTEFRKTFTMNNVVYRIVIEFIDRQAFYPFKNLIRLSIKNGNKLDLYYVDLDTFDFYIDVDGKRKKISEKFKEKILSALPSIGLDDLPSSLNGFKDGISYMFFKRKRGKKGNPYELKQMIPMFYKHRFEEWSDAWLLQLPQMVDKRFKDGVSFSTALNENQDIEETNLFSESIKDNIKNLLMKLKDQEFDRKTFSRIRISDSLFYSEITGEIKIIDPFFSDPKIMELVDLSEIDFTDADIEGFTLSGTGAKIVLNKLYNKSIKGTNLKGISLYGQDLDGIIADGADLRDTGVFVTLDKTSVIGALFSSSTTFALNGQIISDEAAKKMGISVEENNNEINLVTGAMGI